MCLRFRLLEKWYGVKKGGSILVHRAVGLRRDREQISENSRDSERHIRERCLNYVNITSSQPFLRSILPHHRQTQTTTTIERLQRRYEGLICGLDTFVKEPDSRKL